MKVTKTLKMLIIMVFTIIIGINPKGLYAGENDEVIYGGGVKIGSLYYILDEENLTATVTCPPYKHVGHVDYYIEFLDPYEGEIIIPETVVDNGIEYTVTTIGESAFYFQDLVTSVVMPNTILKIKNRAFASTKLTSLVIPASARFIASRAFASQFKEIIYNATNAEIENIGTSNDPFPIVLKKLIIGEDVKILDNGSFSRLENLTDLVYNAIDCELIDNKKENYKSPFPTTVTTLVIGDKVKRIPPSAFYYLSEVENLELPESLEYVGAQAFWGCGKFKTLTIPQSITYMGFGAFVGGTNLTEIIYNAENCVMQKVYSLGEFPANIFYFNQIEKVTIGEKVKSIPAGLFAHSKITNVVIPNSVEHIYPYAFYGNPLENVILPERLDSIDAEAFAYCDKLESIVIPENVKSIGQEAFAYCDNLESIVIPENVKSIGKEAFAYCDKLAEIIYNATECMIEKSNSNCCFPSNVNKIVIGERVKMIPDYAFYKTSISSVIFPQSLESIGEHSFESTKLRSVTFSNSIKSVGANAFNYCNDLREVNISSLKNWTEIEFLSKTANPVTYAKNLFLNGEEIPRKLVIPAGVTRIGNYVFSGLESIVSVYIPESVQSIGNFVFSGCSGLQRTIFSSLVSFLSIKYDSENSTDFGGAIYINDSPLDKTSITIPVEIEKIQDYKFYNWTSLSSVYFSPSVIEIGKSAFSGCTSLTDINLPPNLEFIDERAFANSRMRSITMPKSIKYIGKNAFAFIKPVDHVIIGNVKILVDIESIKDWAKIKFENKESNPIYYAEKFTCNGNNVKYIYLDIPNDSISSYAFVKADNIKSARVSAKTIGTEAFSGISLDSICINVDEIKEGAFSNVSDIYVPRSIPPIAYNNSFAKFDGSHLYVPVGSMKTYEEAENCWWKFLDVSEFDLKKIDELFKPEYEDSIKVESITLSPNEISCVEGESFKIETTVLPDNATNKSLVWSSSDDTVATVDNEGVVTVIQEGICTIIASATDGTDVSAKCIVIGCSEVEGIIADGNGSWCVYDLSGTILFKEVEKEELNRLSAGIYILRQGGRIIKIVKR